MNNAYSLIMLSYFRRKLFLYALLFPVSTIAILLITIFSIEGSRASLAHLLSGFLLPVFGLAIIFTLGMHLKELVANPIAAMLPQGRSKPLITVYWLASACVLVGIATKTPHMDDYGLLAISIFSAALLLFVGYWQSRYMGFVGLIPVLSNHTFLKNIPFLSVTSGSYPELATVYLLLGLGVLGFLAYRVLTINEERREYKFPSLGQLQNRSKTWGTMNDDRTQPLGMRLANYFYREKNFQGLTYNSRHFPEKFMHWRAALGPAYNPVYFMLIMFGLFLFMNLIDTLYTHDTAINYDDKAHISSLTTSIIVLFLYFFSMMASMGLVWQRIPFLQLECSLPLSRKQYVFNMGGMLLIAVYGVWLGVVGATLLSLLIVHPQETVQPSLWMHIAMSACVCFFTYAMACFGTYYAGRNPTVMSIPLALLMAIAMPFFLFSNSSNINGTIFVAAALVSLLLGGIMLKFSYHKWMAAEIL